MIREICKDEAFLAQGPNRPRRMTWPPPPICWIHWCTIRRAVWAWRPT